MVFHGHRLSVRSAVPKERVVYIALTIMLALLGVALAAFQRRVKALARPTTAVYQLRKFARRHKGLVGGGVDGPRRNLPLGRGITTNKGAA